MTIKLSTHVLDTLGLTTDSSTEELQAKLYNLPASYLGIFLSSASREELLDIASNEYKDRLEILKPMFRIEKWLYHEITTGSDKIADVVHIPEVSDELPSTAEKVLARAWNLDKNVIRSASTGELVANRVLFLWRSGYYDKIPNSNRKALHGLFRVGENEIESICGGEWWDRTTLDLLASFRLLSDESNRRNDIGLFTSAICEVTAKWRFLSLYRILERGYYSSILARINQDFMESPKLTMSEALKAIGNECLQFKMLMEKEGLTSYFEEFKESVDTLKEGGNKYAIILDKECKEDRNLKNIVRARADNGVALCYQVRCSIVHSGSHSLVFDEFDDGNNALKLLVGPLEKAVLHYMGIRSF